ncbi:hypothetical protein L3X38_018289 [Prunus dulcis]|uniref:Uncharacterized protein n=1 Tax=Prunus dulcis TaxID=3755 RepID=A0AAD4WBG8_PRUDU|nr:hypothetical protein L3X38_018289 [Prunus dulcis]
MFCLYIYYFTHASFLSSFSFISIPTKRSFLVSDSLCSAIEALLPKLLITHSQLTYTKNSKTHFSNTPDFGS